MHQQHGGRPREAPGRLLETEDRLDSPCDEPALAVQEEKRDHADERRQHYGERDERPQHAPAGELGALEEERERHADRGGEADCDERDPDTRPQCAPLLGPARELGEVLKRPARRLERLGERDEERITDEPQEEEGQERRSEVPAGHSASTGDRLKRVPG